MAILNHADIDPYDSTFVAAWIFEEGNFSPPLDSIGTHHFVNDTTGISYTTGKSGRAGVFTGVAAEALSTPDAASLGASSGFACSFWVNPTALTADQTILYKRLDYLVKILSVSGDISFVVWQTDGTGKQVRSTNSVAVGVWSHVACIADPVSGELYVYVNGTRTGPTAYDSTIDDNNEVLFLGSTSVGSGELNGLLDEVYLWIDTSFTSIDAFAAALYNSGTGLFFTVPVILSRKLIDLNAAVDVASLTDSGAEILGDNSLVSGAIRGDHLLLRFVLYEDEGVVLPFVFGVTDKYEFVVTTDYDADITKIMAYADDDAFNISGDWSSQSLANGKISCRLDLDSNALLSDIDVIPSEIKSYFCALICTPGNTGNHITLWQGEILITNDIYRVGEGTSIIALNPPSQITQLSSSSSISSSSSSLNSSSSCSTSSVNSSSSSCSSPSSSLSSLSSSSSSTSSVNSSSSCSSSSVNSSSSCSSSSVNSSSSCSSSSVNSSCSSQSSSQSGPSSSSCSSSSVNSSSSCSSSSVNSSSSTSVNSSSSSSGGEIFLVYEDDVTIDDENAVGFLSVP